MECACDAVIRQVEERDEAELKRLFTLYCQETRQDGDADVFWSGLPRAPQGMTLVGEDDARLYGFFSMLRVPMAVAPYLAIMGQVAYAEETSRSKVGLILRAGVRWAQAQGIRKFYMFCRDHTMAGWRKHHFSPSLILMERDF